MWKERQDSLEKSFKFENFVEAFAFMTKVAICCEKMDHHPTWTNTYNQVHIVLTTHDAGNKVTEKDKQLAEIIDGCL